MDQGVPTKTKKTLLSTRTISRYGIASALSIAITLGLPVLCVEVFGLTPEIGTAAGLATAFFVNFFSMKFFVYADKGSLGPQMLKFVVYSSVFRLAEYGVFLLLFSVFGVFYAAALVIVLATSFVAKYLVYGRWLFSQSKST